MKKLTAKAINRLMTVAANFESKNSKSGLSSSIQARMEYETSYELKRRLGGLQKEVNKAYEIIAKALSVQFKITDKQAVSILDSKYGVVLGEEIAKYFVNELSSLKVFGLELKQEMKESDVLKKLFDPQNAAAVKDLAELLGN